MQIARVHVSASVAGPLSPSVTFTTHHIANGVRALATPMNAEQSPVINTVFWCGVDFGFVVDSAGSLNVTTLTTNAFGSGAYICNAMVGFAGAYTECVSLRACVIATARSVLVCRRRPWASVSVSSQSLRRGHRDNVLWRSRRLLWRLGARAQLSSKCTYTVTLIFTMLLGKRVVCDRHGRRQRFMCAHYLFCVENYSLPRADCVDACWSCSVFGCSACRFTGGLLGQLDGTCASTCPRNTYVWQHTSCTGELPLSMSISYQTVRTNCAECEYGVLIPCSGPGQWLTSCDGYGLLCALFCCLCRFHAVFQLDCHRHQFLHQ